MSKISQLKWNVAFISFFLSLPTNLILIYLVIQKSPPKLGNYRHLMVYFSILSMTLAAMNCVTQVYILSDDRFVLIMDIKDTIFENHPNVAFFVLGLEGLFSALNCGFFEATIFVISINFIFRYFALERQGRLKYFHGKLLYLWMGAPFFFGAIAMACTYYLGPRDLVTERLRADVKTLYDLDIDRTVYTGCFYFNLDQFGGKVLNFKEIPSVLVINSMTFVSFFSTFFFGFKCYKIVKGLIAQGESEYSRNLQTQLYKALVVQTLIPVFFMFIPVILYFISPYIGIDNHHAGLLIPFFCQLYPALDPIPIIFLIDDYRNAFLNFFRRVLSKNQLAPVEAYEPNQDSLAPG